MLQLSTVLLSAFPLISFPNIKEFFTSNLLLKKGFALVSCGDVWDVHFSADRNDLSLWCGNNKEGNCSDAMLAVVVFHSAF